MRQKKSVISLISYDAAYLASSIKTYYDYVDEIVLGLDKDRVSWSGNTFSFNENKLWSELNAIDGDSKIHIIEDNFHRSSNPIENDTYERNYLKHYCSSDLILSFDADEQLINPNDFFNKFCPLIDFRHDAELSFTWFLLYKEFESGYLIIADETRKNVFTKDVQGFSANRDLHTFTYCRWTNATKKIKSPLAVLHYSFCRPDKELKDKINNFGHSKESKVDPFYAIRDTVTLENYKNLKNFKTSNMGAQWPALLYIEKEKLQGYITEQARAIYA
jgi:hypothetical protein